MKAVIQIFNIQLTNCMTERQKIFFIKQYFLSALNVFLIIVIFFCAALIIIIE